MTEVTASASAAVEGYGMTPPPPPSIPSTSVLRPPLSSSPGTLILVTALLLLHSSPRWTLSFCSCTKGWVRAKKGGAILQLLELYVVLFYVVIHSLCNYRIFFKKNCCVFLDFAFICCDKAHFFSMAISAWSLKVSDLSIEYVYAAILFSCSCLSLFLLFLLFSSPPLKGHYFQMCLPVFSASADGRCSSAAPENQPIPKKEGPRREDEGWWYKGGKGGGSYGKYRTESDKNSAEESSSFCFSPFFPFFFCFSWLSFCVYVE